MNLPLTDAAGLPQVVNRISRKTGLTTALLTVCFTLSYADRHVLSLLVDPIKASLVLSDTQIGLIQGLSFSIFYVLATLPLARYIDRAHRPRVMSACIAIWCTATMLCGLATNFWQLLLTRIGVASSEAGLPPAALTMMADLNDAKGLARATSIFMLAPFLGGGIALMGGGALYATVQHWTLPPMAAFAHLQPWRLVFVLVGAPGLIAAGLVLLLAEPRPNRQNATEEKRFAELFRFLRTNWRFNTYYMLTQAMLVILLNANVSWMPAVLMRAHHVDARAVGLLFGPVFLICGIVGTLAAGFFIGRSALKVIERTFRFMRWGVCIALPATALGPLVPSLWLQIPLISLTILCTSAVMALSSLPFLLIAPIHLRAQAIGFLALVSALVGTGLGPLLVGVLSDRLPFASHPLSLALSIVGSAAATFAALMLHSLVNRIGQTEMP
jgi:MFS family permease